MNENNQTSFQDNQELSKKERRDVLREERQEERDRARRGRGLKRLFFWVSIFAGIGVVVGGIILGVLRGGDNPSNQTPASISGITQTDWVKGDRDARVIVIEYADFQCPACRSYSPIVKALAEEFIDLDVAFALRHFPLRQIHPNAESSSRAAQSAGLQGKFWEMHDMLFDRQDDWAKKRNAEDIFFGYAEGLGLDMEKFRNDFESDAVQQAIEDGVSSGFSAGVNATPSFFINGKFISNPRSIDEFRTLITNAINTSS